MVWFGCLITFINLRGLFIAKAIPVKDNRDKGVHAFLYQYENLIARLEFELAYFKARVQPF